MATTPIREIIALSDVAGEAGQPGVRMKTLWGHPETQRRAVMTRLEPGAELPRHRHVGDELVYVIEGAIADQFGTVTAGNMGYRPNGCVHTVTSRNGATVLAIITGSVEPGRGPPRAPPLRVLRPESLPGARTPPLRRPWPPGRGYQPPPLVPLRSRRGEAAPCWPSSAPPRRA